MYRLTVTLAETTDLVQLSDGTVGLHVRIRNLFR